MPSAALLEAVAVTAELCGRTFSEPAARVFVADLSVYPEAQVIAALARCRKEVRGLLTVADVVQRLEDGRPGPQEAWAMVPKSEAESVVWTSEMAAAFGVCSRLIGEGDMIAARMAFIEAYKAACDKARETGKPVSWSPSLGYDVGMRQSVIEQAERLGRLGTEQAAGLLPAPITPIHQTVQMRIGGAPLRIAK
jgi:hypothetical protein